METRILVPLNVGASILIGGTVVAMLFLLSKAGWGRLLGMYAAPNPPTGRAVRLQIVRIGAVEYEFCVTAWIADDGLYLKVWRKIVLIPWSEFKCVHQMTVFWQRVLVLTVGNPPVTTITVQNDLFEMIRGRLGTSSQETKKPAQ